jgi:hypothetical protein
VLDHTKEHGDALQFGAFSAFVAITMGAQSGCAGVVGCRCVSRRRRSIRSGAKTLEFKGDGRRRAAQHQCDFAGRDTLPVGSCT